MQNKQQLQQLDVVKRSLYPQIVALCPDELMAKSLYATAVRLASNPKIMECTVQSITQCFTRAIDLGLNLDPVFGECDFLPYKKYGQNETELQLQIGAKGHVALAEKLGGWEFQFIAVYDCDVYKKEQVFKNGWMEEGEIIFEPNNEVREANAHNQEWVREHLRLVLANARRTEKGSVQIMSVPVSKGEIERRRLMSTAQKAGNYTKEPDKKLLSAGLPIGIWKDHYLAMAEKTAKALLARKLPKTKATEQFVKALEMELGDTGVYESTATTETATAESAIEKPAQPRDENIEDAYFTDVNNFDAPENVDIEQEAVMILTNTVARENQGLVFTEKRYVLGALNACHDSETLMLFWATVPDNIKHEFQDLFYIRQDLMR